MKIRVLYLLILWLFSVGSISAYCAGNLTVPATLDEAERSILESQEIEIPEPKDETVPSTPSTSNNSTSATKDKDEEREEIKFETKDRKLVTLKGEVIRVEAGTYASAGIDRSISSSEARVGDVGFVVLHSDMDTLDGTIPAGSKIEYVVDYARPARRGFSAPGELRLKAVRANLPDGSKADIDGGYLVMNSKDNDTMLKGNTAAERAQKTALHTGVGAGTGGLWGAIGSIGSGSTGASTAIGAGVGAGIGLITAGFSKGKEVSISAGQRLYLKFPTASTLKIRKTEY